MSDSPARQLPVVEAGLQAAAGKAPVGAVMVVGGGIAGMQASLDLADQGFKVYLVEKGSAIGGKMAQLDKTFPTNDCAMCTISPKLVEVGRHTNIEILTESEVLEVNGQAGDFRVRLQQRARYVDVNKCIACGECTKVCPVLVTDAFNEGLTKRRVISKLYPQGVPNAYAIEKRGIAPCRDACPAGQRAQGYIALIREGRYADALKVIKLDNPFPGICGRICNHRCEDACNRGQVDEPINIRALKRFVTDKMYALPRQPRPPAEVRYPQRVAVIGAGPCGLTAAQDVALAGFRVTVFEAMPVAGGMLRLGVPEYRLPASIIEREVQDIIDLGIDLRLNHRVNDLDEVFAEGFDAVLIAVGAHEGIRLPIPGARREGVLINTHFLKDVRLGRYAPGGDLEGTLGEHVLVLGGGNVAMDCARSAVRLGKKVSLACLEAEGKFLAHPWEVEAARAEGVEIFPGRTFEEVLGDAGGRVSGVACSLVESFSFDDHGRLHVEKVPGSAHVLPCDTVIFSVGQRAGLAFIPGDAGVGITEKQTIAVNPNTLAATRQGVFAAGDSVSGTAFVIDSVASGHTAARSIIRYLQGEHLEPPRKPRLPVVRFGMEEIEARLARGEIRRQNRVPLPEVPVGERVRDFREVEGGYDDESAQLEAARCLACGVCSECMSCVDACGVNAIDHEMPPAEKTLRVGAVILAPGYQTFRAEMAEEFGFGRYPNVVTSLQFERLLSASGPTMGHVQRPSDGKTPARIAFLQCIGSRDQRHDYCSSVCCMAATKEAVMMKEHYPETDIHVFFMDVRAFSKGYWGYFQRAQERYGVHYRRCRVSALAQDPANGDLLLRAVDEDGRQSVERFEMAVLAVGMEISPEVRELGRRLGVELDEYGFCYTPFFDPLETSRPGIYAAGPFREPKDIPESVVEASGAAAAAAERLSAARFSLTVEKEFPPERDVSGESPQVGVFVCRCGSNIAGYLDVPGVAAYAGALPAVTHAEDNLYTCSQDCIAHITEQIKEKGLNRVVVASCTPLTHQPLFQDSLRMAGLNPYLFEMVNIRNQCSWVHSNNWEAATLKAKELVRMGVAKAARLAPQYTLDVPVTQAALVVGGGPAGMTAALSLAEQGFEVHLVERQAELGGNLRRLFVPFPQPHSPAGGAERRDPAETLATLQAAVQAQPRIRVHLHAEVMESKGFTGNFTTLLRAADGAVTEVHHGVVILATGGLEYRGPEYGYGSNRRVATLQELEASLAGQTLDDRPPLDLAAARSAAMILCVGPARAYCSRICCTAALKNALALKERFAALELTILYQDMRVYGFKERLYTQARAAGVQFIRYAPGAPPEIARQEPLVVKVRDGALGRDLVLQPDLLLLAMPMTPHPGARSAATVFKAAQDENGFFQEAHVKLRPVDFATDGVFMAGAAHYPKLLDEALVQARAAAARAARVLSRSTLKAGGRVAVVDAARCTGCLTCVRICPFHVPRIRPDVAGVGGVMGAAFIEPAVCQGCGSCAAECPAKAIDLMYYTDAQLAAKVRALADPDWLRHALGAPVMAAAPNGQPAQPEPAQAD